MGQPGSGKSSLIKKLSYDWVENNRKPYPKKVFECNLYTVQLRHLPKEFKDDPIGVLTNYLQGEYNPSHAPFLWDKEVVYIFFKGYRNSILLFDGLDEFVMNYQLTEEKPLFNQPLLLYMLTYLYLRDGKTPQIGNDIDLYEKLITTVIQRMWENDNHLKKVITSADWNYLYRRFLEELAFLIEFSNNPYATLREIENLSIFKTLKGKTKLSEKDLLGSLLTFFYLHRGGDKDTQTVEFIRKTFQEYLAATNIYHRLLENLHLGKREYENLIWDLFSRKQIPPEVREFLEQIIEKRREEDRKRQNQFLERMKDVFPSLLEKDFVVKPCELKGEKPLNKPLWCFGNLWIFASKVSEVYVKRILLLRK